MIRTFSRREYGKNDLTKKNISRDPIQQFKKWMKDAIKIKIKDPNAMVLATADKKGIPDTRVVLLKELNKKGFIFFTHYTSPKALQAETVGIVALNFYWPPLARQVRIRGTIKRIPRKDSIHYFSSRPRKSQICTLASTQSKVIADRNEVEENIQKLMREFKGKPIPCPKHWGGYLVEPFDIEFFQGRDNRLNDRIRYVKENNHWSTTYLSP